MSCDLSTELLTRPECIGYLSRSTVGRVAVSTGALPAIYTVLFALDAGHIVFRTSSTSRLRRAFCHSVVAFSVDDFDPGDLSGWSVLVRGVGEEVDDPDLVAKLAGLALPAWGEGLESSAFLRLPVEQVSGTRVRAAVQ